MNDLLINFKKQLNNLQDFFKKPEIQGGIFGGIFGGTIVLGIGLLSNSIFPTFDPGLISAGHKAGTGNYLNDPAFFREDLPIYNSFYEMKDNKVELWALFFIELNCDEREEDGDVAASFSFFRNENDTINVIPEQVEMRILNSSVIQRSSEFNSRFHINSDDYHPISEGSNTCLANFIIRARLPLPKNQTDLDKYQVVFQILGNDSPEYQEHLDEVTKENPTRDCSSHDKGTLKYFRCVEEGNTHEIDHITIEKDIPIFKN